MANKQLALIIKFILINDEVVVENCNEIPFIFCVIEKWHQIKLKYCDEDCGVWLEYILKYSEIIQKFNPLIKLGITKVITCFMMSMIKKYKLANSPIVMCYDCGIKRKEKMKKCSNCKLAWYCCDDCHNNNWKYHKRVCKLFSEDIV